MGFQAQCSKLSVREARHGQQKYKDLYGNPDKRLRIRWATVELKSGSNHIGSGKEPHRNEATHNGKVRLFKF